jgi:hypothetical protein
MMRGLRWVIVILLIAGGVLALTRCIPGDPDEPGRLASFTLERRPQDNRFLFDYATILEHYEEGAHRYLRRIAERFHIEALIVTLPGLGTARTIQEIAVDIVNQWEIGRNFEGRGVLFVLVDKQKQVKLEVGYELEDVFTDAFTGYVEDLQLKPYFLAQDIGTGLIAVLEELERRAQIKHQGDYTPGMIAKLDEDLLAGGAGAKRQLTRYQLEASSRSTTSLTPDDGASTPDQAWRIMLSKWAGEGPHVKADIYTEMTKLEMGDQNRPDQRTKAALSHWQGASYQVLQDGDHAVIYFGDKKGWNNAPFLFCKTPSGWKFDIVHQRRLVVMGPNPTWMVEQGDYPYVHLLSKVPQSTGKDLPLSGEDLYSCARDEDYARQIRTLENDVKRRPNDFESVMALARINVITGRRPNHVQPLLKRAKRLNPGHPEPHRYSAIYNVNTFFQYKTALEDIEAYIEQRPDDAFGYNMKGFLHYRLGDYQQSIDVLNKAVEVNPDNVYAYALMARDYALLYQQANKLDPRRSGYKTAALAMLRNAKAAPTHDARRMAWLTSWLKRQQFL